MNGFEVYKIIKKPKNELNYKAEYLYLILMGNPNKTVNDVFLKTPTDKYNKDIYSQAKILFDLWEKIFKKLFNKGIISRNSDQSDILGHKYEESIAEKSEKKIDQSIPKWVKMSEERFNLIKQIINENKSLNTTINNKRYTLKDANDLADKTAKKKKRLARIRPSTFTIIIQ